MGGGGGVTKERGMDGWMVYFCHYKEKGKGGTVLRTKLQSKLSGHSHKQPALLMAALMKPRLSSAFTRIIPVRDRSLFVA